jgi:hypothetical protein
MPKTEVVSEVLSSRVSSSLGFRPDSAHSYYSNDESEEGRGIVRQLLIWLCALFALSGSCV